MPFPFIDIDVYQEQTPTNIEPFREFNWDYINNRFIITNGNIEVIEGVEALKIWIYKCLKTTRGRYFAYSWDYGTDIEELISSNFNKDVTKSEIKRMVGEALLVNNYILECVDFDISFKNETLTVNFTAKTVYGDMDISY